MKIIKIGGSIITKKGIWKEVNIEAANRIAKELRYINEPYIIIHGLGTYGRTYTPLYQNRTIEYNNMTLAKDIQIGTKIFHNEIVKILVRNNVPVRSIDPKSIFICEHSKIKKMFCEIINYYLSIGCVPILHGDTVWDECHKYYLLSSDDMLEYLALQLHPTEVIWATDVDGVYKYIPDNDFTVISELTRKNQDEIWNSEYNEKDITGGMMNKVKISFRLADYGIKSMIINGKVPGNIEKAMLGQQLQGTIIN